MILKKCPHCGGKATTRRIMEGVRFARELGCAKCQIWRHYWQGIRKHNVLTFSRDITYAEACRVWNRRSK